MYNMIRTWYLKASYQYKFLPGIGLGYLWYAIVMIKPKPSLAGIMGSVALEIYDSCT